MQDSKGSFPKYISETLSESHFFVLLAFSHLLIVLPLAHVLNIWMDEASTLYTTQHGFFYAFQNAAADEKQAPFYFWILSLWRDVNHSVFFARIFSIIFNLAAIKLFFDLARRFFNEREAKFITVFFALHPVLIWASLEVRVYSLVILLSILLLKFFSAGFIEDSSENKAAHSRNRVIYILTAIVALYTNYYLGFILAGNFCALLILKRFQAAAAYFWQMLIAALCALPLLLIIKQQLAANTGGFHENPSLIEGIRLLWGHALTFVLPAGLSFNLEPTVVSIIRVWTARLAILLLFFLLVKNRRRAIDAKIILFGTVTITVCLFFLAAYFLTGSEYIQIRHAAPLFVACILFAASLFFKFIPPKIQLIFVFVFAFLFSYSLYNQYSPLAKRGDWIRVANFIEANEKPNQPIVIFQNFDALSLPYYYHGANKILPDKNFFAWDAEDDLKSENALRKQTDFIISQIPIDAAEIWVATEEICQNKETLTACQPLENYLEMNYKVLKTQDFYKERVRLLQKNSVEAKSQ